MEIHWIRNYFFLLCIFIFFFYDKTPAQITPEKIREYATGTIPGEKPILQYPGGIKEFYETSSGRYMWLDEKNEINRKLLLNILKNASFQGLREEDYQYGFMEAFRKAEVSLLSGADSLAAELKFTDAAIHYFNDLAYGSRPLLAYYGLKYIPSCFNIPSRLAYYMASNSLAVLPDHVQPLIPEVKAILLKLKWFKKITDSASYQEEKINSTLVSPSNKPLLIKLFYLGIIDSIDKKLSDKEIKEKVREAQRQFNLLSDGALRSATVRELNVSLVKRLEQMQLAVNYYRWLSCLSKEQQVIVVNIPAAYLKVYYHANVLLEMRMIVGKPATPTPTLSSKINEVILYPYWMVPHNIATKELLPIIKRNPGYIYANNFQVLNKEGKVVNPYSVNWTELSVSYFPYVIRQSTGCDNALGLLKLNFYNPFSVYLHDTPSKSLFTINKRLFSHGCMRMEKPMELGHMVLQNNHIAIDTLEEKGCLRNKAPIIVPANLQMPVIVWYNPVGTDSTGRVIFYGDIYGKFN